MSKRTCVITIVRSLLSGRMSVVSFAWVSGVGLVGRACLAHVVVVVALVRAPRVVALHVMAVVIVLVVALVGALGLIHVVVAYFVLVAGFEARVLGRKAVIAVVFLFV